MIAEDSTLVQTPPQTYADRAAVPRAAPIVVPWPWQRLALGAILVLAAVLNFWQLSQVGYGNTYYAAAVSSMLQSWHAFLFNAFDANGFVTIDKPPLGFWLQVASAKLFGYSGLSLILPQALAGVLSVAVLYRLVSRTFGAGAGLLAALALAVMPVSVAANRSNIVDSTLVLVTLLGAWAVLRAAETGRLRWLLLCAVLVGLGFNVKMLQAFLVVPAFGLLYLLATPRRWITRVWHLAVATVVLLAISLSWVTAVDLTPASQRPYVGSSTHNSALELALGYNGLQRLTGNVFGRGPRPSRPSASGYIIQTGKPVMALGGFLGSDLILTPTTLAQLVANGTVRYFLLQSGQRFRMPSQMLQDVPSSVRNQLEASGRGGFGDFGPGGQASALMQWVSTNCATVPSSLRQTTSSNQSGASAGGLGFGPDNGGPQLYDCASRPSK